MDRVSTAAAVLAAFLLFASVVVITWMVIYRALGNSTYWEIEFSVYMMVAALFLGSPYCLKTGGHIGVDLVSSYLPPGPRRKLAFALAVVGLLVCAYLAYVGGVLTVESMISGERTATSWAAYKWPLYLTMPIGMALTALQYIAEILRMRAAYRGPR
jgi:TRAP-type C4-dicarboxylate transport system permease small subunit